MKLQDVKLTNQVAGHKIAGHENARHEIARQKNRKCIFSFLFFKHATL